MPNQPISTLQLHHRGDQLQQTIEVAHFPAFSSNLAVFESKSKQTQQKNNPQKKKTQKAVVSAICNSTASILHKSILISTARPSH